MSVRKYSEYYEGLEKGVQDRYKEKLDLVGETVDDPFTFDGCSSMNAMPKVEFPDIYTS